MGKVKFTKDPTVRDLVDQIVVRAQRLGCIRPGQAMCVAMDITAVHSNGHPLDLPKLLGAPDDTFAHDVNGIHKYIDRQTGQLTEMFEPRCVLPSHEHAH